MRFARALTNSKDKAAGSQRAVAWKTATSGEGAPLIGRAEPKATDNKDGDSTRRLTFDMSGGAKGAKRPLGRPLDGGVRRQAHHRRAAALAWSAEKNTSP